MITRKILADIIGADEEEIDYRLIPEILGYWGDLNSDDVRFNCYTPDDPDSFENGEVSTLTKQELKEYYYNRKAWNKIRANFRFGN